MPLVGMGAMHLTRYALPLSLAGALLSAAPGCGDSSNHADVYEEDVDGSPLADDRTYAYRVTLFEYSGSVGGFVEFFAIDGVRNTTANPYFEPSACDYFGAGSLANGRFPIAVPGPEGEVALDVVFADGRRRLEVAVTSAGGAWGGSEPSFTLDRVARPPERACAIGPFDER